MSRRKHKQTASHGPHSNGSNGHDRAGNGTKPHTVVAPASVTAPHFVLPQANTHVGATPGGDIGLPTSSAGEVEIIIGGAIGPHEANGGSDDMGANGTGDGVTRVGVALPVPTPVKVRVGIGNGYANGNGNGHDGNGNGNGNGHKVRVANLGRDTMLLAAPRPVTTAHLRASDLDGMRYRLKTALPTQPITPSQRRTRRPLPYFLMRHRNMRARTRVGHVRTQTSIRKFGKGGAATVVVKLGLVFFLLWGMVTTAIAGAGIGGVAWFMGQLPPIDPEHLSKDIVVNGVNVQTTKIYDRNGVPLYDLVSEKTGRREELSLKEISPLVISATIAAEDADFYSNPGIDFRGILRAIQINLSKSGQSGGSTITQQLVRQIILTQEERVKRDGLDGFSRKIKEAVLAVQLTQRYSKDLILEMFLNQNPYGHRAYGIGAAARIYFNKEAKDLSLPEAALLAGLPQAPSAYDPIVHPDQAKIRQAIVLDLMAKQGMITPEQAEAAKAETIVLNPYKIDIKAPHFVYYVKDYLETKYGADFANLGFQVYTTLDLDVQEAAQKVAKDRIEEIRKQKATNAAIVVMKPGTGEILAMVGSVDYNDASIDGQVNVATAERQPGSSFKPITYATAFKKGWTPGTVILDALTQFPVGPGQKPYIPNNYDGRDHGWVTVRESLGNSYNIPAVKGIQFAGIQETIDTAHDMGVKGLNRGLDYYGLSLTLGGGEVSLLDMTTAYSTFANGGKAVAANPILRIVDAQNRVVEQIDPNNVPGDQALDQRIAYMITNVLSDNRARTSSFGPSSPLKLNFPAAAKTGTTDDNKDSWTLGYTPSLAVGVWVGNSNGAVMQSVTGAIGAAVIWNKMMSTFYDNNDFVKLLKKQNSDGSYQKLQEEFVEPDGLIKVSACSNKGGVSDLFLKEEKPKGCINYKDPKGNVQLHSAPIDKPITKPTPKPQTNPQTGPQTQPTPQSQQPQTQPTPRPQAPAKPTPRPGILPPIWPKSP